MNDEDEGAFAIATNEEWRARGVTAENWRPYNLNPDTIPVGLRDLIPIVQRFGVGCDVTRGDLGESMTQADRDELRSALAGRHHEIEDFLYAAPTDSAQADSLGVERHAFRATLVLEMEECDGPGINGYLPYALRKVTEQHSPENAERLREATKFIADNPSIAQFHRAELEAAKAILEPSSG